ncbi:DUF4340 domain-containing protein [Roseomonas nepalensis]|uniref:DUF4340 domain-containing protein n=1 Tax=Muricoccus nepalensis TaxID=1854500 RepID=A0A502G1P7_9PROT|nr:DUF4340 domain-containing protein [Roseomonas nepalensis]TPG55460.1 DUF4340 domain-containing protein [Roseomonas nepalensis]
MPLNRRHLALLGGAAGAAVAAALLLPGDEAAPSPSDAPLAFPALAARLPAARRLEVRQGAASLTLERGAGEAWLIAQKGGYPARGERVRELLVALTELRLAERRTADPEALSRLGLDEPGPNSTALLLRVLDGAGAPLAELVVGRRRTRTQAAAPGSAAESAYVRRPGESQSYLAEGRLPVDADPRLWLDREVANLPEERVRAVVGRRDGQAVELRRGEGPDGRLALVSPAGAPPIDEVSLDEVGRAMEGLTLLDVRPEAEAPGEPAGEGRFTLTDNLAITARLRQADGEVWLTLAAAGDDEAARLNARWRGWAYQVGAWKLPAFAPSLETLRKREG